MSVARFMAVCALFFGCLVLSQRAPSLSVLLAYILGIFAVASSGDGE